MKSLAKTNRFYIVVVATMIAMAVLMIYVFRGIFSSITMAYEVDIVVSDSELKIDKDSLEEAHKITFEKETVPLKVR